MLDRRAFDLRALELPRHEASGVEVVLMQPVVRAELGLKFHLGPPNGFATDHARLIAPWAARRAVRTSWWQFSVVDRFAGLFAESIVVHLLFPIHKPCRLAERAK